MLKELRSQRAKFNYEKIVQYMNDYLMEQESKDAINALDVLLEEVYCQGIIDEIEEQRKAIK